MAYHPHEDWKPLVGQWVQIRVSGGLVDQGTIDDVTQDNDVLWLQAGWGQNRRLFLRNDRVEVWINYKWESNG
ncbi:hypothetical protein [Arthrobacter sp. B1I2]|uniref:hypothetical protein n=1 Tax=Arthrobacter sp. B1I2 TaxID=3042263 RepID=UPI002787DDDE|nr:hypothetical protein [Arthrobacter sp. B1I2]MDQ0733434.1 hypothetical protein [Arthrobacter sp. B1I2]